jgi:excisionase family DNA binding protein
MKGTPAQLAAYVGKSERTIHRWLASGKLPHTRLAGGLVEVDDRLLFAPDEQEGAILARLTRIEEKLDRLSADVAALSASRPRVHVHTEQAAYTPRPAPAPAQGDLPEGLMAWRDYAREKGYAETTVKRHIDAGEIPIITGRWKRGHAVILAAIDDEGMRAMDALFSGG